MNKEYDENDLLFEDLFSDEEPAETAIKQKRLVTNEDVLFMVGYNSNGNDVCTEGFITNRYAAMIAMEEARNKHEGEWVDILEFNETGSKETLVGTFKVTEDLVTMKITGIPKIEQHAERFSQLMDKEEN